jgi:hypothetical protein
MQANNPTPTMVVVTLLNCVMMAYVWYQVLTQQDWVVLLSTAVFLTSSYTAARLWFAHLGGPDELKRRSWVLGGIAALLLSVLGAPVAYNVLLHWRDPSYFTSIVSTDYSYSRVAVVFFSAEMVLDMVIGCLDYPLQMGMATAFLHHTLFLLGGWATLHNHCSGYFLACCVVELPTLVLAVGSMYKPFRADLLFGVLFLLTRVGYSVWFTVMLGLYANMPLFTFMMIPSLMMNFYWFYSWGVGYLKRGKVEGAKRKN